MAEFLYYSFSHWLVQGESFCTYRNCVRNLRENFAFT